VQGNTLKATCINRKKSIKRGNSSNEKTTKKIIIVIYTVYANLFIKMTLIRIKKLDNLESDITKLECIEVT